MPAAPPRSAPARGGAAPARGGATAEARGAAPARPAAAGGGGGCFTKMCPNGKLKNDGKQTGIGCCIIGYAIFCSLAAFTRGWYSVRYSPDSSVETCSMPLWECSLSACKPKDSHTGYHGEGECSQQQFAQVMFLFAAIYAMCYLFFISGVLRPGNVTKWTQADFSECCTFSSDCTPPLIPPIPHVCPAEHGVMLCGVPFFMLLGLIFILAQDRSEFEGMPEQGFGALFWISLIMAIVMLLVACFTTKAEAGLQAGAARALPPRPPPRNPAPAGGGARRQMPPSAPNGFSYYNPPDTKPSTVQTAQLLATADIKVTTQINRVGVDPGWVSLPADFGTLIRRA